MTNNNKRAAVNVGNGFTKEQAAEAPEDNPLLGPLAGGILGNDPDEGTTEDLGANEAIPSN